MNQVAPTATFFSLGYNFTTNKSGEDYIAYCFNSIEGYSKFGRYEGNNNDDGTYVYLGFKPAWLLIKNIDTGGISWTLIDSVRDPTNTAYNNIFFANTTGELNHDANKYLDILSNGFKLRSQSAGVNNGASFIYHAFAETPVKHANAR